MPKYVKYLKEIMSNKRKLEDLARITLSEECLAILQNKLPQKLKDPGSFTIPCTIGSLSIDRALADLGAGINLMPYSMFKRLGLGEPRPTRMSIQLADRSVRHPRGIIKNVLVKVDKFIFPTDFVIIDMDENFEVPLILGRPFLATGRALIDVEQRKLILRVQNEEIVLEMRQVKQAFPSYEEYSCLKVDATDKTIVNTPQNPSLKDLLADNIESRTRAKPTLDRVSEKAEQPVPTCKTPKKGIGGTIAYIQGLGLFTYTHHFPFKE